MQVIGLMFYKRKPARDKTGYNLHFYRVQEVRQKKKRATLQKNTANTTKLSKCTILKSSTTALRLQSIGLNGFQLRDQIVPSAWTLKNKVIGLICVSTRSSFVAGRLARHRKCVTAVGSAMNFLGFLFSVSFQKAPPRTGAPCPGCEAARLLSGTQRQTVKLSTSSGRA